MIAAFYDLRQQRALRSALRDLCGYWKLWSTCILQSASLPVLGGIIVTRWSPEVKKHVHILLKRLKATKALIRQDIKNEAPPYPRGGFLVQEDLLPEILNFFFQLGRIIAIYEPADAVLNSYNLNVLFAAAADVYVEVIGPGFDASDLQRGDLSPHELFSIRLAHDGKISDLRRVSAVDEKAYEESRQLRIKKLRQKFQEWPTPELARKIYNDLKLPSQMDDYLEKMRSPLAEAKTYVPISQSLVTSTVGAIVDSNVIAVFQRKTGTGFPLNFSTSFVDYGRRQVYWDIVSPKLKFQGLKL